MKKLLWIVAMLVLSLGVTFAADTGANVWSKTVVTKINAKKVDTKKNMKKTVVTKVVKKTTMWTGSVWTGMMKKVEAKVLPTTKTTTTKKTAVKTVKKWDAVCSASETSVWAYTYKTKEGKTINVNSYCRKLENKKQ